MKRDKGLCYGCVRFHPKAKGNCVLARSWASLERKHKFKLAVTDCEWFASQEETFPEENAQPTKTGNLKIDGDESKV